MNTNELIKYYSEQLDFCKSQMYEINCVTKEHYGDQWFETVNELNAEIDRLESLLSILSRSQIRVTADEPPTREDADKFGRVLTYDSFAETWLRVSVEMILGDKTFTHWTHLPEANP